MKARIRRPIERLVAIGARPTDTSEERIQKATVVLGAVLIIILSFAWVAIYWALGLWLAGAIPLTYQVLSVAGLFVLARTKGLAPFRTGQSLMFLFFPYLLQWTLGGFVASSGVALWALWAPLGLLVTEGIGPARRWFVAYLALLALSGLVDPALSAHPAAIPGGLRLAFFVLNIAGVSATGFILLAYFSTQRAKVLAALREEQARSERLLLNILPASVATRLKLQPEAIADGFAEATVLLADIVDFTTISADMKPEELVAWLNEVFTAFDHLAERHGLEKIKTIGDAYMVVGGLPTPQADHVTAVADMALEMQRWVAPRRAPNGDPLRVRIGIHTGPVVAGVIGVRKFSYDLWGDTVNTASRMESHGVGGSIQVTEPVYERLRSTHRFGDQRIIPVKGKGMMPVYFLLGRQGDAVPAVAGV